jgi:general stress protein YciG
MELQNKTGFARLSPEERQRIASLGGKTGDRNKFTTESASEAGKKGGKSKNPNKGFGTTRKKKTDD